MVLHSNTIPNGHFHKKWQKHLKTWFNQPMRKKRRSMKRKAKINQRLPMPAEHLRPMVRCPTFRYNSKVRVGRGFSLQELKAAGLNKKFAQTIGIAVDARRMNKSIEGMNVNVQRLKGYRSKLIIFSLNKKKQRDELKKPVTTVTNGINKPMVVKAKVKARIPSEEAKKFSAFECLRKARADAKYVGIRAKRKKMQVENIEPPTKKVRLQPQEGD